jgi:hypothetical protein
MIISLPCQVDINGLATLASLMPSIARVADTRAGERAKRTDDSALHTDPWEN